MSLEDLSPEGRLFHCSTHRTLKKFFQNRFDQLGWERLSESLVFLVALIVAWFAIVNQVLASTSSSPWSIFQTSTISPPGPDKLQICADLKSGEKMYLFENVEQKCTFLLTNRGFQNGKTLENRIFRELVTIFF